MAERKVIMQFDPRYLELQEELKHHPALCIKLSKTGLDIRDKLSCIATHLGLAIDEVLDVELVHQMMAGFTKELRKQRSILVVTTAGGWSH